jgi:hypothetical protein
VPVQTPAWQTSFTVHMLPSLHAVPSALFGFVQTPVLGLHVPGALNLTHLTQTKISIQKNTHDSH